MKAVILPVAACLALAAGPACAAEGWYVSGALGASWREAVRQTTTSTRDPFGNSVTLDGAPVLFGYATRQSYDTGLNVDAAVGRRLASVWHGALRAEVEFEYRRFDQGRTTTERLPNAVESYPFVVDARPSSGLTEQRYAGTVNAFYDLAGFGALTPYLGAGVGYQHGESASGVRARTITTQANGAPLVRTDTVAVAGASDDDGTFLVEGGVSVPLWGRLSLAPAYRYTDTFGGGHASHVFKVGLRYSF